MSRVRWLTLALFVFASLTGGACALQFQEAASLRREITLLQDESRALGRLLAENARLKAIQVPTRELERLRADHAAIVRLRGEIERMKTRIGARAR